MRAIESKLLKLLSSQELTFFIPPYQRNYEWTRDQCEVFYDDIVKTADANGEAHSEHFFGTVTYFEGVTAATETDRLVLIDGQQRITTTMLFLAALRDSIEDRDIKRSINNRYLRNPESTGETEYRIKLKQVESDWPTYRAIILNEDIPVGGFSTPVFRNYSYFKQELAKLPSDEERRRLLDEGLINFSVVEVALEPERNKWENPQEIFESMNSLGKPLSLADLVRNYLLLGLSAEEQDDLYHDYWLKIEQYLPDDDSKEVSNFIRDYMQLIEQDFLKQAGDKNNKELYREFKRMFGRANAKELLSELASYSLIYSYIVFGKSTGNESVDGLLSDLRYRRSTTARSFEMALLGAWRDGKLSDNDIEICLKALRSYIFRRRLIGATAGENRIIPKMAREMGRIIGSDDKWKTMFEVFSGYEFAARVPNDLEMRGQLNDDDNFYHNAFATITLAMVEESLTKSRPRLDDPNLQIEHIMPQTLNREWRYDLGPDADLIHDREVNKLGNLTLIRHNQELGNESFERKKMIYRDNAGLQIAKTLITDCDKWNAEAIERRQKWLIDRILNDVLPVPDSMRQKNNYTENKRRSGKNLSLKELGLIGKEIHFVEDDSITATVVDENKVMFEGEETKLSPLTRKIYTRLGRANASGAYQGGNYWTYNGVKLIDMWNQ